MGKKALHGSVYGNGIYISPLWQYSQCYSEPKLVNGQHCYPMLMCRADPDKIHKQSDEIWTVPSEHSVYCYNLLFAGCGHKRAETNYHYTGDECNSDNDCCVYHTCQHGRC